jgi:hypothetical protein
MRIKEWKSPMRTEARELLAVGILGRDSRIGDRIESLLGRSTFSSRLAPARVCAAAAALFVLTITAARAPQWIAFAQQLPPGFEVSVIKPNTSGTMLVHMQPSAGGRFTAENVTLRYLLMSAWNVNDFQIVNAPAWVKTERYDLAAKSEANPSGAQMSGPMLQALVTQRFKLSLHREVRQLPVYALTVTKSGAKLPASRAGSCLPWSSTSIAPLSSPLRQPNDPIPCGFRGLQPVAGGWKLNMAACRWCVRYTVP